ncbi:MAG: bifunctional glutamate N-acetyltransferase/amino-acid acetyltransferase ArgJ [Cellvibrionales bacterium]|nr:bifunctional glutamate N-acetyltransferase/amino-acid acetyltransferase ArgJ [Cellvibrionales bacterium]
MATGHFPLPEFHSFSTIKLGTANAGIKQRERDDVTLIALDESVRLSAVFTKNAFCAAPVVLAKEAIKKTSTRFLLINTGNANAGTGVGGFVSAEACMQAVAERGAVSADAVLPFSTGVIGEPLPHDKIISVLDSAFEALDASHWAQAATAILTTDTRPKGVSSSLLVGDKSMRFNGICKGSGMINPNMATMLAYAAVDLSISQASLDALLKKANAKSFNCITVDSDTSTNDAVVLMATGESGVDYDNLASNEKLEVEQWLTDQFIALSQLIIRDGEGATKFIEVTVAEGASEDECDAVAYAIAHSPLVKTALFASDPNWGRLLMAIGKAPVADLDIQKVRVAINGEPLVDAGEKVSAFTEEVGQRLFSEEDIQIRVELNRGECETTIWTSDLSHEYIKINAEYRT